MKFKAQPNLYVKLSNKIVQRVTGLKGFTFNEEGEYETENELLIKVLSQNFEAIEENIETESTPLNSVGQSESINSENEKQEIKEDVNGLAAEESESTLNVFKCKKCDYETTNKGELLAHYKEHKKEE